MLLKRRSRCVASSCLVLGPGQTALPSKGTTATAHRLSGAFSNDLSPGEREGGRSHLSGPRVSQGTYMAPPPTPPPSCNSALGLGLWPWLVLCVQCGPIFSAFSDLPLYV